jgi:hypothetical protein
MNRGIAAQLKRRSSYAVQFAQIRDDDGNVWVPRRVHDPLADSQTGLGIADEQDDARAEVGELGCALESET